MKLSFQLSDLVISDPDPAERPNPQLELPRRQLDPFRETNPDRIQLIFAEISQERCRADNICLEGKIAKEIAKLIDREVDDKRLLDRSNFPPEVVKIIMDNVPEHFDENLPKTKHRALTKLLNQLQKGEGPQFFMTSNIISKIFSLDLNK